MAKDYRIESYISLTEFTKGLATSPMDREIVNSPHGYPFLRLTLGDAKMVGCSNKNGHVDQLLPIGPEEDGHQRIVEILEGLFSIQIIEEDLEAMMPRMLRTSTAENSAEDWGFK